jgi:biotin carboxyl carrier protein
MKTYKVKVNGKVYQVEVECVTDDGKTSAPVQAAAVAKAPVAAQTAPVQAAQAGDVTVKAPMAGTINDVKVSVGQQVNKGDVVVILEAMKLENEVKSTATGTVKAVSVAKGQAVTSGQAIIIIG